MKEGCSMLSLLLLPFQTDFIDGDDQCKALDVEGIGVTCLVRVEEPKAQPNMRRMLDCGATGATVLTGVCIFAFLGDGSTSPSAFCCSLIWRCSA